MTGENTHGFRGALSPRSALGRPPGNRNVARVQNQRVPEDEQAFTDNGRRLKGGW